MSTRLHFPPARWGAWLTVVTLVLIMFWWTRTDEAGANPQASSAPAALARHGVLDLSAWDFTSRAPVPLDGDWQFFWTQLLEPEEVVAEPGPQATGYIAVPGAWNGYPVGSTPLPGNGYATYQLRVLLPATSPPLAMQIPYASTAYRLFVNGQEVAANGVVGTGPQTSRPQYRPLLVPIPSQGGALEVVMQVSNFAHRRGGMWHSIRLGPHAQLIAQDTQAVIIQVVVFGGILFIGLSHLALFGLRRHMPSALYFGLFCLLIVVRLVTTGELVLIRLLPDFPWRLLIRAEYMSAQLMIPAFYRLLAALYPAEVPRKIVRGALVVGLLLAASTILLPVDIRTRFVLLDHLAILAAAVYCLYVLVQATVRRRDHALLFLLGTAMLVLATFNDVFYNHRAFSASIPLAPVGLLPLILIQSYIIARQYAAAFANLEVMTAQHASLAQRAQQHLDELRSARTLLTAQDEGLRKTVAEFLHSRVQTKLHLIWHKIAHAEEMMMRSPQQASESLEDARTQLDQVREEEIRQASHRLHPSAVSVSLVAALDGLAEEYQHYFAIAIRTSPEISRLDSPSANQIPELVRLTAYRVVAEALQNAAIHSSATTVRMNLDVVPQEQLAVVVSDNGRGFDTATVEEGLGLRIVAARIIERGGTWNLHSAPGSGTTLTVTIPLHDPYIAG